MVKINSKYRILVLVLMFTVMLTSNSYAGKRRIYDEANLFTSEEIGSLDKTCEKYSKRRKTDFIVLTTNDPKWRDAEDYMQYMYDKEEFGYDKNKGNTVILTINTNSRDIYVSGFGKGKDFIDYYRAELILDYIYPSIKEGNYFSAAQIFLSKAYKYLSVDINKNPESILLSSFFQLFLAFMIALISLVSMLTKSKGRVTVNSQTYKNHASSRIIDKKDRYIRTSVTRTRIPQNNNSNNGGSGGGFSSGSGGGTTSGGSSYSGSGRSF